MSMNKQTNEIKDIRHALRITPQFLYFLVKLRVIGLISLKPIKNDPQIIKLGFLIIGIKEYPKRL